MAEIYIYIGLTCLAHVWSRNLLYVFFHSSSALVSFVDPLETKNPPYDSEIIKWPKNYHEPGWVL